MWRSKVQGVQRFVVLLAPVLFWVLPLSTAYAQSDFDQGTAAYERGAFESAIESFTRAARSAEKAGDVPARISALVHLGDAYAALGRYRQAATVLDAAVGVAEKSGDQSRLAWILARLGNVLIATGPPG